MELKFRAKDSKGNWVYSDSRKKEGGKLYYLVNGEWIEVRPETEGVWTCLKDEKGKDIYEHDIVDIKDSCGEWIRVKVFWDYRRGCWNLVDKHGLNYYDFYEGKTPLEYPEEIEVVGNVIDNPEIIKEEVGHEED